MLKVLVAPLDWGLGHATRCIPIIKELIIEGYTVIIAASGAQKAILQEEFPALSFVEIPGYRIKYTKNRAFTVMKIIWNIPKILIRIKAENRWLRVFLRHTPVDMVVSDNRYGLYAEGIGSIFMTHQLAIRTGFGRAADGWLRRLNYALIRRFMACWVPDAPGPDNLAGDLSHPPRMPEISVKYIGWLSRLEPQPAATGAKSGPGRTQASFDGVDLLLLLSGPEPQRTVLEKLLLAQLGQCDLGRVVLVRGLPRGGMSPVAIPSVEVHDYAGAVALARLVGKSRIVLSRPGYSTVMDLAKLGKRAIFVPTPGQAEQEYLGQYLAGKGWAVCRKQRRFLLRDAFEEAEKLKAGTWPEGGGDPRLLRQAIRAITGQSARDFG